MSSTSKRPLDDTDQSSVKKKTKNEEKQSQGLFSSLWQRFTSHKTKEGESTDILPKTKILNKGYLLTPDGSAPPCDKPIIKNNSVKTETIDKIELSTCQFNLTRKQDLQIVDAFCSYYGYNHSQNLIHLSRTDKFDFLSREGDMEENGAFFVTKVPVINIENEVHNTLLSDEAIKVLQDIESVTGYENEGLYTDFLSHFGSHVAVSKFVSLGTMVECVVICEYDTPDQNIMNSVYDNIKTYSENLEVDAWYPAQDFVDEGVFEKEKLARHRVRVKSLCDLTKDLDCLKDEGIQANELHILERRNVETLTIWELITKCKHLFQNAESLSVKLKDVWSDIYEMNKEAIQHEIQMDDMQERNSNSTNDARSTTQVVPMEIEDKIDNTDVSTERQQLDDDNIIMELLKQLDLNNFYPCKMSKTDVLSIRNDMPEISSNNLYQHFLERLIRIDIRCRENKVISRNRSRISNQKQNINPLDVILAGFLCSDASLRQLIATKLFMCRLAIPFVLPAPNKVTVSMWPLRKLVMEWKGVSEASFVKHPMHILSFMRIGRHSISKSELINNLISDSQHPTFLHRNSPLGNIKKKISTGMIEISHFLPGRNEEDRIFENEIALLNLRGDSVNYHIQVDIILKMSSITIVLVDLQELKDETVLLKLSQYKNKTGGKLVILITNNSNIVSPYNDVKTEYLQGINRENINYISEFFCDEDTDKKNIPEIIEELRETIKDILGKLTLRTNSIEGHVQCMHNVNLDEDDFVGFEKGKADAQKLISLLVKGNRTPHKSMLPLQGKQWKQFAVYQKMMYRPMKDVTSNNYEAILSKITNCRLEQFKECQEMKPFMTTLIDFLVKSKDREISFFLEWLKLELNEYSRKILPHLRAIYYSRWDNYQESRDKESKDKLQILFKDYKKAESDFFEAGVGLEHLMRELGQAYECTLKCCDVENSLSPPWTVDLPKVGAHLLLSGMPFEIMDGDAGCVPIDWVVEVFKNLRNLVGNKRVYVLSCIGIQSSGKSTLLNTMFGLEFAVGAGRVTRGVYAQLLPVDKQSCDVPFDYLIVLDSEGLRAPERDELNYTNDNELATFVIGLSDMTLINIKGENIVEMSNVLEIVCQALVRMREADSLKRIKKQKCMFLHQNVSDVNADEKISSGHKLLRDNLEKRIQDVAKMENCHVSSFTQIIDFENDKHAYYLTDLWNGDPPMAHANIGYSVDVKKLKDKLLECAEESRTIKSFGIGLQDMWKGVISDDFVYHFRNNLCAKAYIDMEVSYASVKRGIESSIMEWLNQSCRGKIMTCKTENELNVCYQTLILELTKKVSDLSDKGIEELKDFFEKSDLREILEQWKEEKVICMKTDSSMILHDTELELEGYRNQQRVEVRKQHLEPSIEIEMIEKATVLAENLKGTNILEDKIVKVFDEMWKKLETELSPNTIAERNNVVEIVEGVLWNKFINHRYILKQILNDHWVLQTSKVIPTQLEDSFSKINLMEKIHYSQKNYGQQRFRRISNDNKMIVLNFINHVMRTIDTKLDTLLEIDRPFHKSIAEDIIYDVCESFDAFNDRNDAECPIVLKIKLKVTIAVHVARLSLPRFEQMNENFENRHGVKARVSAYKRKVFNLFKNNVQNRTEEVKAADLFCDSLVDVIVKSIDSNMSRRIVDEVLQNITIKYHLIVKILESLANETNKTEQLRGYNDYSSNPKAFAKRFLTQYTKRFIFTSINGTSRYCSFALDQFNKYIQCIKESVTAANDVVHDKPSATLHEWINEFCRHSSTVLFTQSHIFGTRALLNKKVNFSIFYRMVMNRLHSETDDQCLRALVLNVFDNRETDKLSWEGSTPYEQLSKRLWGCNEICPFCHEPCQNSRVQHNGDHTCIQHKPIGVRGTLDKYSKKLCIKICNSEVCSRSSFNCSACDEKCRESLECTATDNKADHSFREYRQYVTSWDIAPDASGEASHYWKWYMATFGASLAESHAANPPDIPNSWTNIRREEAIESLYRYLD